MTALVASREKTHTCDFRSALEHIASYANEPMKSRATAADVVRIAQAALGKKANRGD